MMGDWVMYNPNVFIEDEYESFKEWEKIRIQSGEDINLADEDCYEPIPLTPEILEKNGFSSKTFLSDEWEREVYFREFPGCVLELNDDGKYTFGTTCYWHKNDADGSPVDCGTMYDSRINGVHYVHELQRALRCCGLWDLAENFQI